MRRSLVIALTVAALAAACQPKLPAPSGGPGIAPSGHPSWQGIITEVLGPRLKVESAVPGPAGATEAVVMVASNARIMKRDGTQLRLQNLDLDMKVSLWFTSPGDIRNGRIHATATTIVVEPD